MGEQKAKRNYEIDFVKFILTIMVLICHLRLFIGKGSPIASFKPVFLHFGTWAVHAFFIISGFLMAKSIDTRKADGDSAKSALTFVLKKYKGICLPLIVSTSVAFVLQIFLYLNSEKFAKLYSSFYDMISSFIPSTLGLYAGFSQHQVNGVIWYISAMLICMLPLSFIMYKKRNFFLYVFAPLCAIFTYSYLFNNGMAFDFQLVMNNMLVREFCGLSFGSVSYLIYLNAGKLSKGFLTVLEVVCYAVPFLGLFTADEKTEFYTALLLPMAIAISFSQKTYIAPLFGFKWMSKLSSLNLAIYLNHITARNIVYRLIPTNSFKQGALMTILITAALILVYYLLIFICRKLAPKVRKICFDQQPKDEI